VGGGEISVDSHGLRAAARSAGVLGEDARAQMGLFAAATSQAADAAGNLEAANAVLDFAARWSQELASLTQVVTGIETGLNLTVSAYERVDQGNADGFARRDR
jgi:hypothetical protein